MKHFLGIYGEAKVSFIIHPTQISKQHKICPIGKVDVEVNINGLKDISKFKVIRIMDKKDLSPALLGIYWAFENNEILNFEYGNMSYKQGEL